MLQQTTWRKNRVKKGNLRIWCCAKLNQSGKRSVHGLVRSDSDWEVVRKQNLIRRNFAFDWLTDWSSYWLIDLLIDCLFVWLIARVIDWFIDRLIGTLCRLNTAYTDHWLEFTSSWIEMPDDWFQWLGHTIYITHLMGVACVPCQFTRSISWHTKSCRICMNLAWERISKWTVILPRYIQMEAGQKNAFFSEQENHCSILHSWVPCWFSEVATTGHVGITIGMRHAFIAGDPNFCTQLTPSAVPGVPLWEFT